MIASVDPVNRLIYLDVTTVNATIQPIDIYRELRTLRATTPSLRGYDMFLTMRGADKKNADGSKRTERYMVLLGGTYIVPYDTSHILTIDGTIISDSGLEGIECFNRASLSVGVEVDINYVPKQVEVITVNISGAGASAAEIWAYANRTLTQSVSGLTAAEIWEYTNRTLTQAVGSITAAEVWAYASRSLTTATNVSESNMHSILNSYADKDAWKADTNEIASAVWGYTI